MTSSDTTLGSYRLIGRLGRGGMGEVWLAEDDRATPPTRVALKLLRLADDDGARRFAREVEILAGLDHPGIVHALSGLERDGDRAFYAMELVLGRDLAAVLQAGGPLAPPHAVQVVCDLLEALATAHDAGVVHRDVKPSNVLIDRDGRPRLTDFGLAQAADRSRLTATATVLGTPSYMSPEQADGRPATAASDLYSAGALLFELLAGRPPFVAPKPIALLRMHLEKPPPALTNLAPDVPPALAAVVARALAKAPGDRPPDARAMAADLRAALDPAVSLDPKASTVILRQRVEQLGEVEPELVASTVLEPPPGADAAPAAAEPSASAAATARRGAPPPTSRLAVTSLVLGILSYAVCLFPLTGLPAVVAGHLALARIRRAGGRLLGAGSATGGLYLGYVALALTAVVAIGASAVMPDRAGCRTRLQALARQLNAASPPRRSLIATPADLKGAFCPEAPTVGYGYLPFTWSPPNGAVVLWCSHHGQGVTIDGDEPTYTGDELDVDFPAMLAASRRAFADPFGQEDRGD